MSDSEISYHKEFDEIDVVIGGPPCQGFSMAGRRNIRDPRNSLFMEFCKYIDYFQPKIFMMENVMGILSMLTENKEKVIDIIMEKLTENYNCCIKKLAISIILQIKFILLF